MSWIAAAPGNYNGMVVGDGHCVAFVRAASGAPHTSGWRAGERLSFAQNATPGIAIATFGYDNRYQNATDGSSHAAVLLYVHPDALEVLDQWVGRKVGPRLIRFKKGNGLPCDDGDAYRVIEADAGPAAA
jgi:hypothetical protein